MSAQQLHELVDLAVEWDALKFRLINDDPVPDVCDYKDFEHNLSHELAALNRDLDQIIPQEIQMFPIPKGPETMRPMAVPGARDRLAYRGIVSPMVGKLDSGLGAEVYAQRVDFGSRSWKLRPHSRPHTEMRSNIVSLVKESGYKSMAHVDVSSYYPSIQTSKLVPFLSSRNCPQPCISGLDRFLRHAHGVGVFSGLPIMPEPSAVLGTSFLMSVDDALRAEGHTFFRWVDDVRILARSGTEAQDGVALVRERVRDLGLHLAEEKTAILSGQDIIKSLQDPAKDSLVTALREQDPEAMSACHDFFNERIAAVEWPVESDISFIVKILIKRDDNYGSRHMASHPVKFYMQSPLLGQYLEAWGGDSKVVDEIMVFLEQARSERDNWAVLHLLRAVSGWPRLGPPEARMLGALANDRNRHPLVRAMGFRALSAHDCRFIKDIEEGGLIAEPSRAVKRAMLISFRWTRSRSPKFFGEVGRLYPELSSTIKWAKCW